MNVRLARGVRCRFHDKEDAADPDIIRFCRSMTINRAGLAIGPTDYYGKIHRHEGGNSAFSIDGDTGRLQLVRGGKKRRRTRTPSDAVAAVKPFAVNMTWVLSVGDDDTIHSDRNVFGSSGIAHATSPGIQWRDIPVVHALDSQEYLRETFGVTFTPFGDPLPKVNTDVHVVSYHLKEGFLDDWVYSENGGPGIFFERHRFPHFFTPATPETRGPFVLGRNMDGTKHEFVGVFVPYGYTMNVPAGCIHNDWHVVGSMVTTLAMDDQAEVVFLRDSARSNKKPRMHFKWTS